MQITITIINWYDFRFASKRILFFKLVVKLCSHSKEHTLHYVNVFHSRAGNHTIISIICVCAHSHYLKGGAEQHIIRYRQSKSAEQHEEDALTLTR